MFKINNFRGLLCSMPYESQMNSNKFVSKINYDCELTKKVLYCYIVCVRKRIMYNVLFPIYYYHYVYAVLDLSVRSL